PRVRDKNSQARLLEVIQHEVQRLDRLITDISDASRLDAELAREDAKRIEMKAFLADYVNASQQTGDSRKPVTIEFKVEKLPPGAKDYAVMGHDLRLGQVITNLIDNARSFVPEKDGKIVVTLARTSRNVI